jgi:predicted acetyltransferase
VPVELVRAGPDHLASYRDALERGFSPDNITPEPTRLAQVAAIAADPAAFLATQEDLIGGTPITLPDGTTRPRLPGFRRWIWDGAMLGVVNFRFQPGTAELPSHVLGHCGYAVVPWARGRGVATRALALLLPEAAALGLPHLDLTTDPDNPASIRVIERNGGMLLRRFTKDAAYGGGEGLLFRIALHHAA